jgi:TetR/AcrR family transcriptional regulator
MKRDYKKEAERTRELVLTQSMAEFALKGYDGARVDSIARRCNLSKFTLYHYFGSKEGLFVAVLERAYQKLRSHQHDLSISTNDPLRAMRQLIVHTFSAFLANRDLIALLNSENLHKGRHIRKSKIIRSLYDPLIGTIRETLQKGVAEGIFRPNIDPINLYVSLSALAYNVISNQYTLKMALGIDFTSPKYRKVWLAHITELILSFCRSHR